MTFLLKYVSVGRIMQCSQQMLIVLKILTPFVYIICISNSISPFTYNFVYDMYIFTLAYYCTKFQVLVLWISIICTLNICVFIAGVKILIIHVYIVLWWYLHSTSSSCPSSFPHYLVAFIFLIVTLIFVKHLFVSMDVRKHMMLDISVSGLFYIMW